MAVNVLMPRPSVLFTEQVLFTSFYKVKPQALILPKKPKHLGKCMIQSGLVQIFAK